MKLTRDIFRRGTRMSHAFGSLTEVRDPLCNQTFEAPWPKRVDQLSARPGRSMEIQGHGEYTYRPHSSPVSKPGGGHASIQGPAPDHVMGHAMLVPVGTERRVVPPEPRTEVKDLVGRSGRRK